jgi:hypothetical protein
VKLWYIFIFIFMGLEKGSRKKKHIPFVAIWQGF